MNVLSFIPVTAAKNINYAQIIEQLFLWDVAN